MSDASSSTAQLHLPSQLTIESANRAIAQLRQAADAAQSGSVTVDASALQHFDTASVAVLLGLRRHLLRNGRGMLVTGIPEHLKELIRLYGVSELLTA